jgi:hypothetical protein
MKIKNVTGTAGEKCNCYSWLAHWEKFSGKKATFCGHHTCQEKTDLVGAHVKKVGEYDFEVYILPLCKEHNKSTLEIEVYSSYPLVPADKKRTCGKG